MLQVIRVTQALMMTELETLLGPAGARPSGLTRPGSRLGLFILFALTQSESDHAAAVAARAVTNGPGPGIH